MDKKPLIVVSICAVVLLVVSSLSNVVGYQSVKSTVNDSPLFQTRTQRATNQQQNSITSQYIGIGNGNHIQFPVQFYGPEQLKKVIEIVSKMDDTTFERYLAEYIQTIQKDIPFRDTTLIEVYHAIHQLRITPEQALNVVIPKKNFQTRAVFLPTSGEITACGQWVPGCILKVILTRIVNFLIEIFQRPTVAWLCWHSGQIPCNIL